MWKPDYDCVSLVSQFDKLTEPQISKLQYAINTITNFCNRNYKDGGNYFIKHCFAIGSVAYVNKMDIEGVMKSYDGDNYFVISFQVGTVGGFDVAFRYTRDQNDQLTLDQIKF